ncbi:MAG: hypothetical protein R3B92_03040 [Patescibacteria group bacterium]|uniref:Uncharacterized protein n=1 Tax=candidate division WWE3 bacterium TaxID=2053526 RepID=A0A955EBY5_UNCKA|nr:hypothetical protein [candidate division WWE3 bacterium]
MSYDLSTDEQIVYDYLVSCKQGARPLHIQQYCWSKGVTVNFHDVLDSLISKGFVTQVQGKPHTLYYAK